jgi:hypothetical protein
MTNKSKVKLLIFFIIGIILLFLIFSFCFVNKIYINVFRLTSDEISIFLSDVKPQCTEIVNCELLPGDILIRRYITKRTWLIDKLANPYFTHSAFYLGDNQLVEAVGREKDKKDDIKIVDLSTSDWFNSDINNFVIIRPKNYFSKLDIIKSKLINIAEDPDHIFGFYRQGYKRATCGDLIFRPLFDEKIINVFSNRPKIITPDYLFWVLVNNCNNSEIIGYRIEK